MGFSRVQSGTDWLHISLSATLQGCCLHRANPAAVGTARMTLESLVDGGFVLKFIPSSSSCWGCPTAGALHVALAPLSCVGVGMGGREPATLACFHWMVPLGDPLLLLSGSFLAAVCCWDIARAARDENWACYLLIWNSIIWKQIMFLFEG